MNDKQLTRNYYIFQYRKNYIGKMWKEKIIYIYRAFSVAAPNLWNSLPKHIRDCTDTPTSKSRTKNTPF